MRQVVLDTETTGLEVELHHRVIEIGCVELVNRRLTGRKFHRYLNPEREVDEGARQVHGMSLASLSDKPKFADVHAEFVEFVSGAELIIHNAPFDVGFIDYEFTRFARDTASAPSSLGGLCRVLDTLVLARQMHPGQRNSLDALCKRYFVDNSHREYHGALLDARILAEVYLAMTGGQVTFTLNTADLVHAVRVEAMTSASAGDRHIPVVLANDEEAQAHESLLALLDKASGGKTLWRRP